MRASFGACAVALGLLAGCRFHAPAPQPRQAILTIGPVAAELPLTAATRIEPDLRTLAKTPVRQVSASTEVAYRALTQSACRCRAAKYAPLADALDDEGSVPQPPQNPPPCPLPAGRGSKSGSPSLQGGGWGVGSCVSAKCETASDQLKQTVRFHTALELRNRAAADALDRYFQLANAEVAADLLRQSFPIIDDLIAKAKAARAADVQFPLVVADLERQRSRMRGQLEQAEATSELLNIDLKRRLGLPPLSERLWPTGEFGIDTSPADAESAVNAALTDRPELRGLRAVYANLSVDTLPVARDVLRTGNPLLGASPPPPRGLARFLPKKHHPDAETLAELAVRRKQLADLIAARERDVADETRAAVVSLNAQTRRVQLARDRLDAWAAQRAEAVKKREANQPGAALLESQVTLDWQKARAEAISEVMAWHQARARLKAAQGWLAWECMEIVAQAF